MPTIKIGQIVPYCHFNKIIKESGTSFQPPAFSQKNVRSVFHTAHKYLTKFHFDSAQDSKEISISVSVSSNAYDDVTDFEICRFHKNTKILISQELNIFSSNKKIHSLNTKGYFMTKNSFVVEVPFNLYLTNISNTL